MTYKINPYHQLIWRNPGDLQLGIGSKRVILSAISAAQEKLIDALYFGVPSIQLEALIALIKIPKAQAEEVLGSVKPLLVEDRSGRVDSQHSVSEQIRASLQNGVDAVSVLAARSQASVQILNLDATGMSLLLGLAAAGVGSFTSPDLERVSEADCATNLYPRALLGYRRFQAAKLILDSSWPGSKLQQSARISKNTPQPSLVVLTSHQVTDPNEVGRWRIAEVPQLEIKYDTDGFTVSPVLGLAGGHTPELAYIPGCLNCAANHAQAADPAHFAIATQLIDSNLRFDDASSRNLAVGLAQRLILEHLDSRAFVRAAEPKRTGFRFEGESAALTRIDEWQPHPSCSCQINLEQVLAVAV